MEWAENNLRPICYDCHYLKHVQYKKIITFHPDFVKLIPFTIIRKEEDRLRSYINLCKNFDLSRKKVWTDEWEGIVIASKTWELDKFQKRYFEPTAYFIEGSEGRLVTFPYEVGHKKCTDWLLKIHDLPNL